MTCTASLLPRWAASWRALSAAIACFMLATAALSAAPSVAWTHPTSPGRTSIQVHADTRTIDLLTEVNREDLGEFLKLDTDGNNITDLKEIEAGKETLRAYIVKNLSITNNDAACTVTQQRFVPSDARSKRVRYLQQWTCADPLAALAISNRILFDDVGGHRHLARVQLGDDVRTTTFAREFPVYTLTLTPPTDGSAIDAPKAAAEPLLSLLARYVWEGVLHIWIGLDHVLFIICLLLVARRFQTLLAVITAFTVGHSVTLILSALDWVIVPASVIEPIIALSIAVVAIENILRAEPDNAPRHRHALTFAFGLIHGFGFSYVLRDDVGLPTDALLPALLTFNVGVELGQLAIVALLWPLLMRAMKHDRYPTFVRASSGLVGLLAVYWVIERTVLA